MNNNPMHAELMVLLKNAFDDIERTKQMQWRDFYNVLIAIGAVTGFYVATRDVLKIQWMHHLFFVAPAAFMILGVWLVWIHKHVLDQRRALVEHGYYPLLDSGLKTILNGPLGQSLYRNVHPWLYTSVIAITAAFSSAVMVGLSLSAG